MSAKVVKVRTILRVVHEYQEKIGPETWGPVKERYNNELVIDPDDSRAIEVFLRTFRGRITSEPLSKGEHVWARKFEGVWGYRWKDRRIELVTETTTEDAKVLV